MAVEAPPPSLSSLAVLRNRLRATTVCCFVGSGGHQGLAERMRWRRRRAGAGDFRYDPLSYALNFDQGDDHGVDGGDDRAGGRLDSGSRGGRRPPPPSRPPSRSVWPERRESLVIDE